MERYQRAEGNKYSLCYAYLFWLFGGWVGMHHFYLRRYRQGVLWLTSFGGLFGIGLLRDFSRLRNYVRDANKNQDILSNEQRELGPRLLSNWHLLVGQVLFGVFYRGLILCAIPWESSVMNYAPYIAPLGTAFGTYMISNVGRQESHFCLSLIGAYIGEYLVGVPHLLTRDAILVAGVSMICSTIGWQWRTEREDISWWKVLLMVLLVYCLFIVFFGSYVYNNATIQTEDGETIKVNEAFNNLFNSPAWQEVNTGFWELYDLLVTSGFKTFWDKLKDLADIDGEYSAYNVLDLEPGTDFGKIRKKYKELAKKWHPDHQKGEEMKAIAQEEFMRIKNAYEVLENVHKRRTKFKNKFRL